MCINRCASVIFCGQIVVQSPKDWRGLECQSNKHHLPRNHCKHQWKHNCQIHWRPLNDEQLQRDRNAPHVCSLLEQSSLDLLPGVLAALVCVHAKQDAQATRQAAGLLLQQVGLRLPLETLNTRTHRCARLQSRPFIKFSSLSLVMGDNSFIRICSSSPMLRIHICA